MSLSEGGVLADSQGWQCASLTPCESALSSLEPAWDRQRALQHKQWFLCLSSCWKNQSEPGIHSLVTVSRTLLTGSEWLKSEMLNDSSAKKHSLPRQTVFQPEPDSIHFSIPLPLKYILYPCMVVQSACPHRSVWRWPSHTGAPVGTPSCHVRWHGDWLTGIPQRSPFQTHQTTTSGCIKVNESKRWMCKLQTKWLKTCCTLFWCRWKIGNVAQTRLVTLAYNSKILCFKECSLTKLEI